MAKEQREKARIVPSYKKQSEDYSVAVNLFMVEVARER